MIRCYDLKCENLINPVGIDEKNPRFSWKIESDKQNVTQKMFEICVGDHYSKCVKTDQSICFEYDGVPLKPKTKYEYKVRVWDNDDEVSEWEYGYFITGLMGEKPVAKWLGVESSKKEIPVYLKTFNIDNTKNAYLFASAYGLYEIFINGKRLGDNYFAPGFTSYEKRLQYQMYEICDYLECGENKIEIYLGKGWFAGRYPFQTEKPKNSFCAVMCQVEIDNEIILTTDKSWNQFDSPIMFSEFYDGEIYDSTKENKYENQADVTIYDIGYDNLVWNCSVPVKIVGEVKPVEMFKTPKGETVIDFGQNMVGWVEIKVCGDRGSKIKISHAEVLDKDGNFYTENMRTAKNEVIFITNGEKEQTYHPHFSFQGFRYIRIDECDMSVSLDNFVGKVICSDININAEFKSSNKLLNRLFSNVLWGQRGNFVDIPTDCPQRDERVGWSGDAQIFMSTALKNSDSSAFFTKWLLDMSADQKQDGLVPIFIPSMDEEKTASAWGDCATVCPIELYKAYGDKKFLSKMYPMMKNWVRYIRNQGGEFLWNDGFQFGDWLGLDAQEGSYEGATDKYYIATAFYAYSTYLTMKASEVLGFMDDTIKYERLYKSIVSEFRKAYLDENGDPITKTQTAYVLGLYMNLFENPGEYALKLSQMIKTNANRLKTGFVGTPYLCYALSENGYSDICYDLLLQEEYPSWLYPVTKGATTIWEHWDGIKPDGSMWSEDMNSYNHYAYGSIMDWVYSVVCGIKTDISYPAYKKFVVKPCVTNRLKFCRVEYNTPYGRVASGWENLDNGKIRISVKIPCNTSAQIILPNGESYQKGSGEYVFEC